MNAFEFEPFPKIARLKRETVITEKLDGTNAQVAIFALSLLEIRHAAVDPYCIKLFPGEGGTTYAMYAGSRKRWVAPEGTPRLDKGCDNFGFAAWVKENSHQLIRLGPGRHYGEWYGKGIQRGYGLDEKRFALFHTARWGGHNPNTPPCCEVVTLLEDDPDEAMETLSLYGSRHVPGYLQPEGIVVYHTASRTLYKQTFDHDGGKWRES